MFVMFYIVANQRKNIPPEMTIQECVYYTRVLAIRRIFSLVDMKFSNCPNVFKIGVVQQ